MRVIDPTAILLRRMRLDVVGGVAVTTPFVVTEVYVVQRGGRWALGALAFTRRL